METTNNTGKVIGALLMGAAIGATLGVLFAPDKGSRTRRKIMTKGQDMTDQLKDKIDDLVDDVKEEIETIKDKVHEFRGMNGSDKTEKVKAR